MNNSKITFQLKLPHILRNILYLISVVWKVWQCLLIIVYHIKVQYSFINNFPWNIVLCLIMTLILHIPKDFFLFFSYCIYSEKRHCRCLFISEILCLLIYFHELGVPYLLLKGSVCWSSYLQNFIISFTFVLQV